MTRLDKFLDSYAHYRGPVGCGRIYALYRALFYEIKHREPTKWSGGSIT